AYGLIVSEAKYKNEQHQVGKSEDHLRGDKEHRKDEKIITEYLFKDSELYVREFRNQILDFIACNPPRFGLNWFCTMDVAIRISNWITAYDLFRAYGVSFDQEFEKNFVRSVYEHGRHIFKNLEWDDLHRNNHYLAGITGLLFIAAYLPSSVEVDGWLQFCFQELISEVIRQFHPDGTNFEASTSYHRLSAEMVIYSTALICSLPFEKKSALKNYKNPKSILKNSQTENDEVAITFPLAYLERLERMIEFTIHITKPDGNIPQIGDNDSGRFLKLLPACHFIQVADAKRRYLNLDNYTDLPDNTVVWEVNDLDHRHLVSAANGLFGRSDFYKFAGNEHFEELIIRELSEENLFPAKKVDTRKYEAYKKECGKREAFIEFNSKLNSLHDSQIQVYEFSVPEGGLIDGFEWYAYPDFGLYLYRSKLLYLAIRCGQIGQNGNGGHAHNDQLSIELNIDGVNLITDPGTYLYTSIPEKRNMYRSVKAHFTPILESDREPGKISKGPFTLGNEAGAYCVYFGEMGFLGKHSGYGDLVYRKIELENNLLKIIDCTTGNVNLKRNDYSREKILHSPGYGVLLR
ncbi:MAG: hypothetical protein HOK72_03675, partial [Flavobacteriales bacterium]|nr:hypothetical protein [Flavobacteriales bacterium]